MPAGIDVLANRVSGRGVVRSLDPILKPESEKATIGGIPHGVPRRTPVPKL
jgi:hypothetical protein